ncbi:MAG TPA: plastocyanin/azurin family copper-binding protein [Planctomycetota bacterium]
MKALSVALAVASCSLLILGAAAAAPLQDVKVEITDKGFTPQQAEVTAGQSVIWMNTSKHEHTVTARAAAAPDQDEKDKAKPMFDSGPIKPGASFSYKFDKAGTYTYACTIDKTMTGVVVVKERK